MLREGDARHELHRDEAGPHARLAGGQDVDDGRVRDRLGDLLFGEKTDPDLLRDAPVDVLAQHLARERPERLAIAGEIHLGKSALSDALDDAVSPKLGGRPWRARPTGLGAVVRDARASVPSTRRPAQKSRARAAVARQPPKWPKSASI